MRKSGMICFIALFVVLTINTYSQTDSLRNNTVKLSEYYLGMGYGFGFIGFISGLSGTVVFSNNWGGSIGIKRDGYKSANIPDDFSETQFNIILPRDKTNFISMTLLKEFPSHNKKVEYGIEAGPSLVINRLVNFSINPNYPDGGLWGLPVNKYIKSYEKKQAFGLSLRSKVEFPVKNFFSVDFAVYSDINKLQSFLGLECYVNFGFFKN
jgi:hypothetical protein